MMSPLGNNLILVNLVYLHCKVIGLHVDRDKQIFESYHRIGVHVNMLNVYGILESSCCAVYIVLLATVFKK